MIYAIYSLLRSHSWSSIHLPNSYLTAHTVFHNSCAENLQSHVCFLTFYWKSHSCYWSKYCLSTFVSEWKVHFEWFCILLSAHMNLLVFWKFISPSLYTCVESIHSFFCVLFLTFCCKRQHVNEELSPSRY